MTEIPITKRAGVFRCPSCRTLRPYRWRGVRQFVTIYFVPLIPLMEVSEHVRCMVCKEHFSPRVLEGGSAGARVDSSRVSGAVILAAARLVFLDGTPSPAEIVELQRLITDRTGIAPTIDEVRSLRDWVIGAASPTASEWLERPQRLSQQQRERAIRDIFLVASADCDLRSGQVEELTELQWSLEISKKRFRQLIDESCRIATTDEVEKANAAL